MTTMPQDSNMTDLLIIGGGPAGMFVALRRNAPSFGKTYREHASA